MLGAAACSTTFAVIPRAIACGEAPVTIDTLPSVTAAPTTITGMSCRARPFALTSSSRRSFAVVPSGATKSHMRTGPTSLPSPMMPSRLVVSCALRTLARSRSADLSDAIVFSTRSTSWSAGAFTSSESRDTSTCSRARNR